MPVFLCALRPETLRGDWSAEVVTALVDDDLRAEHTQH